MSLCRAGVEILFAWVIISQSRSTYQMNGKWLCSLKGCWKYNTFPDLKFRQIISKISIFYWTVFIFPVRSPLCLPGKPLIWEHHTIHSTLEILSDGPGTCPKPETYMVRADVAPPRLAHKAWISALWVTVLWFADAEQCSWNWKANILSEGAI